MEVINLSVYSTIRKIAKKRNISIYQIEHDLNLSNGSISKWNSSIPRADKLQKVADYLGVTTMFILNDANERGRTR